MDSLILTFNKEQLNLYKELLEKDDIDLNFNTGLQEIFPFFVCNLDEAINKIENETKMLLNFNKHSSPFSLILTQEEINALIPIYYGTIREIKKQTNVIGSDAWKLSLKIAEIDKAIADINKRYSNFLPYKAALYKNDKHSAKISEIDGQFIKSIETADNLKKELLSIFEKSEKFTNIVDDFIQKTSKASDEPKFKKFNAHDFFWAVEAFAEQIKNI